LAFDETQDKLGTELKISPQFNLSHDELKALMQRDDPIAILGRNKSLPLALG